MMEKGFQEQECPVRRTWNDYDKSVKRKLRCGDFSNMQAFGTVLTNEMDLYSDFFLGMSINLEYYRKPLESYERQLQLVSLYEKRELDGIALANCCSAILHRRICKKGFGTMHVNLSSRLYGKSKNDRELTKKYWVYESFLVIRG